MKNKVTSSNDRLSLFISIRKTTKVNIEPSGCLTKSELSSPLAFRKHLKGKGGDSSREQKEHRENTRQHLCLTSLIEREAPKNVCRH